MAETTKKKKKKKNGKKTAIICIVVAIVLTVLMTMATVLMNKYSTTMSSIFGFGEMQVTQLAAIAPNLTGFVIQ